MVWNDNTRAIQPATNVAGVFVTHSQPSKHNAHNTHTVPFFPYHRPKRSLALLARRRAVS